MLKYKTKISHSINVYKLNESNNNQENLKKHVKDYKKTWQPISMNIKI